MCVCVCVCVCVCDIYTIDRCAKWQIFFIFCYKIIYCIMHYICMFVYIYLCVCVCVFVYTHTHT